MAWEGDSSRYPSQIFLSAENSLSYNNATAKRWDSSGKRENAETHDEVENINQKINDHLSRRDDVEATRIELMQNLMDEKT